MEQNTRIYQNLKQLNIITFWEIADSEDYRLMDVDFDENKEYSDNDMISFQAAYLKLYDDYFEAKDSSIQRNTLQDNDKQSKETYKLFLLSELYKTLQLLELNKHALKEDDFLQMLNETYSSILLLEKRVRINRMDSIKFNAEKLKRIIDSLNNKLLLNDKRTKQEKQKEVKKFKNHYENIASLEQVFKRSVGDISKINCIQWLAYEKEAEKLIKIKKQNGSRKSHS